MLYISVILSLILLVFANVSVHRPSGWRQTFFVFGAAFAFGTLLLGFFLPPVAILFVALLVAMLPWFFGSPRPWLFVPLSCLALATAFGITGWSAWETQREYARLRVQFPYESFEERLPPPQSAYRLGGIPEPIERRLSQVENNLGRESRTLRVHLLSELHEETTTLFINSPGFGVARMVRPSGRLLIPEQSPDASILQPVPSSPSGRSFEDVQWQPRRSDEDLLQTHQGGVLDFVNPRGFGFVKDRRHVAGFQSHQFTSVPVFDKQREVQTIDLVGLLRHTDPVAYLSDHLPRMDELRGAPTRPLTGFEASGLEKMKRGEDLVIGAAGDRLRMLGSIRSTKQCIQCHGGERGDLLGAFSYTLKQGQP